VLLELLVLILIVLLNGFFAMSELAIVRARRARLEAMAKSGEPGAARASALAENPARLLSAVQVGVTLLSLLAGAFGGATLAQRLAEGLVAFGAGPEAAEFVAVGIVVLVIGYATLILGELVPKQLALARPERIAARVAGPMILFTRLVGPLVALLEGSSRTVLRLFGRAAEPTEAPSEQEIGALVAEAESAGVVEPEEKRMIGRVLRLGDLPVRAIMTPRHEIDWLDLDRPLDELLGRLAASPHSRLPVGRGRVDEVTGVLRAKDVMAELAAGRTPDPARLARTPPAVHEGADVLAALAALRTTDLDMVLVVDEYGTCEGLLASADVLGAIAGELPGPGAAAEPDAVRRPDGSWLLDGAKGIDAAAELLGLELPAERDYHTVAGLVLDRLRRLPRGRRCLRSPGLALRGGRHGRPAHRQSVGDPAAILRGASTEPPRRRSGNEAPRHADEARPARGAGSAAIATGGPSAHR
jgi:putative hemolysin